MVNRTPSPKVFFTTEEKKRIVQAIREAEQETSGEIRVYLERKARIETLKRAERVFEKIGMAQTQERTGVLIYFSLTDHSFAVLGDRGIHDRVGDSFWRDVVSAIEPLFSRQDFAGGLEAGIRRIGEKLRAYFPRRGDDSNELPDEISA